MIPIAQGYHYGFAGPVGAHTAPRALPPEPRFPPLTGGGVVAPELGPNDIVQFNDNRTYVLDLDHDNPIENAAIQAADQKRPYVLVRSGNGAAANLLPASGTPRGFRIEGLWIGSDDDLGDFIVERAIPALTTLDWDEIVISQSTIDPGGVRADQTVIPPLRLWIHGRVRRLVIERSIVGPIHVREVLADCSQSGLVEELVIRDSIVDATRLTGEPAIDCQTGRVELRGVTVLGDVEALLLDASDSLVMGRLHVLNQDESCFRFSAASPGDPEEGLPRRFESSTSIEIQRAFFTSLRFGDPGYAQLSLLAPPELARGAEGGSELGAFSFLRRPIRLASVVAKVDEFKPAGVIAQYIFEGERPETPEEEP